MAALTVSDIKPKYEELLASLIVDRAQLTDLKRRVYANEALLNAYRLALEEQSDG